MSLKKYVPQPIKKFIIKLKRKAFDNKKKLTLKKICKIIDVEVPSNLKKVQNIKFIKFDKQHLLLLSLCLILFRFVYKKNKFYKSLMNLFSNLNSCLHIF